MTSPPVDISYWRGTKIRFRRPVTGVTGLPVSLSASDGARIHGLFWHSDKNPNPKVVVIAAHPRVDFREHHTFPDLLEAGYGCLGANLRSVNNDMACLHEKLVIDIATYMSWLKERGVEKIILLGNSGGGSLFSFYQAQAKAAPSERILNTPGGLPTGLQDQDLPLGDAMIFMAAHTGQGLIINEVIDPSATDEGDPFKTDPSLDMYDPGNGFQPAPAWSEYEPEFVDRYRAAQIKRVRRLDEVALKFIQDSDDAEAKMADPSFKNLSTASHREVEQLKAFEPVMVIYRTLANLHYADNRLDLSQRGYGSLISPRPDVANFRSVGFARVLTPQGWLSTWSGLSSNANVLKTAPTITEPALVINAGRDLDVYPNTHSRKIFETISSKDKQYWDFPKALHYFEPEDGKQEALETLMAKLLPWIQERFPL